MAQESANDHLTPRGLAVLLGTAALALVLSAPAHAQVAVDYNQLDGVGSAAIAPAYDEVRPVRSPLMPAEAASAVDPDTAVIAGALPEKNPIALKPLAKWKLPAPAQPISLGEAAPILLRPPGSAANHVIGELARQSPALALHPARLADNVPLLHLRPPAPKPPMQLTAVSTVAPAPMPSTQVAFAPPMTVTPQTQIAMPVSPPPRMQTQISMAQPIMPPQPVMASPPIMPQTQIAAAPPAVSAPHSMPVLPSSNLTPEDVVALDLGAPKHEDTPNNTPVPSPAPMPVKKSDAAPYLPPLPAPPPAPQTAKTAAANPQFISPLAEDLPTEDAATSNEDHNQIAATAPAPSAPERPAPKPKQAAQSHANDNIKTAAAAPPKFISSLGEDEDTSASEAEFEPAPVLTPEPAPAPMPAPKQHLAAAAPAPTMTASVSDMPPPPAPKKTGFLKDPTPAAAPSFRATTVAANSDIKTTHASAQEAADTVAENLAQPAPQKSSAPEIMVAAAAPQVAPEPAPVSAAAVTAPPASPVQADNDEMQKLHQQIDQANQKVDEAQKTIDALNARQAQADMEAKAKAQEQVTAAALPPPAPVEHSEAAPALKPAATAPVREAALSSNAVNDAVGPAAHPGPVQHTVLFQPNVSALPDNAAPEIQQLAQEMKNNPDAKVVIRAYASAAGQSGSAARRVSLQRAVLVRDELNKMGVSINRVAVQAQAVDPGTADPDRVEISVE